MTGCPHETYPAERWAVIILAAVAARFLAFAMASLVLVCKAPKTTPIRFQVSDAFGNRLNLLTFTGPMRSAAEDTCVIGQF